MMRIDLFKHLKIKFELVYPVHTMTHWPKRVRKFLFNLKWSQVVNWTEDLILNELYCILKIAVSVCTFLDH